MYYEALIDVQQPNTMIYFVLNFFKACFLQCMMDLATDMKGLLVPAVERKQNECQWLLEERVYNVGEGNVAL